MTDQFDNTFAIKEGWCISEVGSDTPFRLEKWDESTVFQTDQEAWNFVYDLAVKGSYYHNSALVYLNHNSPKELRTIREYYNKNSALVYLNHNSPKELRTIREYYNKWQSY